VAPVVAPDHDIGWKGAHMRKLVSYFFISLDGVVEAPDKWRFPA
jgi:hypothetical protein